MNKELLKKIGIGAGIILFFLGLSYGFVPQVLDGKIVNQSDISGYVGMSHEMTVWNDSHPDDPTYWTGSMFGGMPTTAISTRNGGDWTQPLYDLLLTGKRPATYLFIALLGAFLLMLSLGVSWPLAIGGAIAIAFCSYNFQIIQVGHNTKMQAIAFMPWALAALVYTYRTEKWPRVLLGAALFGLAVSLQVKANHQQITYYLAIMILLYALVELIDTLVRHKERFRMFALSSALLLVLGGAGIATNVNKLLPLAKYTPHTMRGGSELSGGNQGSSSGGLDIAYATAWSYGWEELPNLMIPNFNGGASAQAVNPDKSETVRVLRSAGQRNVRDVAKALPMYWGPQPFTAGPMYMGAITVFLFVLGLCLYPKREKWWLLAVTVLAVLMAVGNNFLWFTKLCFNILPLYNKFRTVSMALVILQLSLPVLGFLALDRIVKGGVEKKKLHRGIMIAGCVTGCVCMLFWLFPSLAGDFSSASDAGMQDVLVRALRADRRALLKADAFVSFLLILATAGLLRWAMSPKGQTEHAKAFAGFGRMQIAGVCISLLVLVNMFTVGKRYLNSSHFTTPRDFNRPFALRPVDEEILQDQDPSYRVLDLTVDVFNSSVPSYHHKSIGGYSPAKLQRYQDLITRSLSGEINGIYNALGTAQTIGDVSAYMAASTPMLNALNTRYLILDADFPPVENPAALGNAWFVESVVPAATPDEELAFTCNASLASQAVIGADMTLPGEAGEASPADTIVLTSYAPNELHYSYSASAPRLAVFSEIYYPGWKATVDGEPLEVLRADWTLRAALLPEGEHEVVMRFEPDSYRVGAAVSRASSVLLILMLLLSAGLLLKKKEQ